MHPLILLAAMAGPADDALVSLTAGRVAGAPSSCISVPDIDDVRVVGGLVAYRIGDTLWVNRPIEGAKLLREDDVLAARTPTGRLCDRDLLYRVNRNSGAPMGFVRLGDFTPYRRPAKR